MTKLILVYLHDGLHLYRSDLENIMLRNIQVAEDYL